MGKVCYIPLTGIDDVIAQQLGWNTTNEYDEVVPDKFRVAMLRSMYDETGNPELNLDNVEEVKDKIVNFIHDIHVVNSRKIKDATTKQAKSWERLRASFPTLRERTDRVNMVSILFSSAVDDLQRLYPTKSREDILRGFKDDGGNIRGGEANIFSIVYEKLLSDRGKYYVASQDDTLYGEGQRKEYARKADAIANVINNWDTICSRARFILRDTEGIILGNKKNYALTGTSENFDEEDFSELYDPSESKREHYSETADMKSAIGSIGQQVRRFLSTIPVYTYNIRPDGTGGFITEFVPEKDDLGFTRFQDPTTTHQSLIELLRGIQSEEDMMGRLIDPVSGEPVKAWLAPVVSLLAKNPRLRTQFFVDFKRNFQPYSIMFEDKKRSTAQSKWLSTKLLNKISGKETIGKYLARISTRFLGPKSGRIFNPNRANSRKLPNVDWENVKKLWEVVKDWTYEDTEVKKVGIFNTRVSIGEPSKLTNKKGDKNNAQKMMFLVDTLTALGIDCSVATAESIINSNDIYRIREALYDLFANGINLVVPFVNKSVSELPEMTMRELFNKVQKADDSTPKVKEHIEKLVKIVDNHSEYRKIEGRARYMGKTRFSDVAPSYLGDMTEAIKSYAEQNNKEGLRDYLLNKFGKTSYFVETDANGNIRFRNFWLQKLLECCDTPRTVHLTDTFAGKFDFERFLGTDSLEFENFTSKQHCVDMLTHYCADAAQNKSFKTSVSYYNEATQKTEVGVGRETSALFPVFVLGDSGVSKYMRAPTIVGANGTFGDTEKNLILDKLYDVYLQERERMKLVAAVNDKLRRDGYSPVHSRPEFVFLPFLNGENIPVNANETTIKKIIKDNLEKACSEFIQKADSMGIFETVKEGEQTSYKYLRSVSSPTKMQEKMQEFYWNTKLANICQMQMMTIDISYYENTKDLQKRYKEIHAPGTKLSLTAQNPYKPGEYFNPQIPVTVDYYENGVKKQKTVMVPAPERCAYFDDINTDISEDNPEMEEAILAHPKTARYIKKYRERTSLTDGQGYRSLTSYRKVMGMAGKWTKDMEDLYDEIMELRRVYGTKDENGILMAAIPAKGTKEYEDYMTRLESIASKSVIFQPLKPYMFTHETFDINGTDKMMIPVQHKYAEVVLIPELLPQKSKLRDMAYWMDSRKDVNGEDAPVDLICATTAVKVGGFGSTSIKGTNDRASLLSALGKAYVHELDYADYRIQTNVPNHVNSSQLFGTQVRKLIMSGLKLNSDHYSKYVGNKNVNLGGKWGKGKLNGRRLLSLYNSLITANILDSYTKFSGIVSDINKVSDILSQATLFNSRESMDNLLAYALTEDENFLMPLFEGGLEHDSMALLLSTFKKMVNKQSIKGGSAVQASSLGITDYSENGDLRFVVDPNNSKNILYAECEIPFDLSFKDSVTGEEVYLNYADYCDEDGYLIPSKYEIKPGSDEYSKYLSYTYKEVDGKLVPCKYDDPDAKVYKPKLEVEYPDILSFIAYRIPTERAYSMLNMRVKKFSRKTAGGTIKVPPQGTRIAGFDFDIDKLYFMMREYVRHTYVNEYDMENYSQEERYEIFGQIYEEHPAVKEALKRAREGAEGKNSKTPLHEFWKVARIEEVFGLNKDEAFTAKVKELDYEPDEVVTKKTSYDYFESYNFNKTPEQNTRTARNNLLIELIQQRLMDEETFDERYTPGGFPVHSSAARSMRELEYGNLDGLVENGKVNFDELHDREARGEQDPEPNYDPTDPMTAIIYNQQNQVAGKLIGIFSNQNVHHAFCKLMNKFQLKDSYAKAIEFAGHSFAKDGVGKDFIHPPHRADGMNDVDVYMAELLAASVDAVKDPTLNFLNLNTVTADSGAVLIRLGYTPEEVGLLFKQPIIVQLCQNIFDNSLNFDQAVSELKASLKEHKKYKKYTPDFSKNNLALSIINNRKSKEAGESTMKYLEKNADEQLAILELFKTIHSVSDDINSFIGATKFTASNSVSSTAGGMYAQQEKVKDFASKFEKNEKGELTTKLSFEAEVVPRNPTIADEMVGPIVDSHAVDLMNWDTTEGRQRYMDWCRTNPFAYEQCMYDANKKALKRIVNKYYPYETSMYHKIRERLQKLALYALDDETIDSIHRDTLVHALATQRNSPFCGESPHKVNGVEDGLTNREYYIGGKFAEDVVELYETSENLLELPIFQFLRPILLDKEKPTDPDKFILKLIDAGGINAFTREEIKESWASLVATDKDGRFLNPKHAQLAKDLFMYCYYTLGFEYGPYTFMSFCPTAVKELITVPREHSIPVNFHNGMEGTGTEIYVFDKDNQEQRDVAFNEYGYNAAAGTRQVGNSFRLECDFDLVTDEKLSLNINSFFELCINAKSTPDLVYKVQMELTQADIDAIAAARIDIPSNVHFTEKTVVENDWSGVNYGVNRSYREFLMDIQSGKFSAVDETELAKLYMLNHLDNYRFVFDVKAKNLKEFLEKNAIGNDGKPGFRVFGAYKDTLTIDVSNKKDDAINSFVTVEKVGDRQNFIWKPILKIENAYYMAVGGVEGFNEGGPRMVYKKVEPLGKKGRSMAYVLDMFDHNIVTEPQEDNVRGTDPITDPSLDRGEPYNRDAVIAQLTSEYFEAMRDREMVASFGVLDEDEKRDFFRETFSSYDDAVLQQLVEDLRKACRTDEGVLMLDEEGNMMQGC